MRRGGSSVTSSMGAGVVAVKAAVNKREQQLKRMWWETASMKERWQQQHRQITARKVDRAAAQKDVVGDCSFEGKVATAAEVDNS